jgi:shikimate dehydrogenase
VKLAVLGDPLPYTRSPDLHRAGLAALGIACESRAIRTPASELGARLAALAAEGYTGVNLTHPLKEAALDHLARVSDAARRARSVNTVGFAPEGAWGDTTDGAGFVDWLADLGRDPARERVVMFGAGGAARSLALALIASGCASLTMATRDPSRAEAAWRAIAGARIVRRGDEAHEIREATAVVNAAPDAGETGPVDPAALAPSTLVIDLTYREAITPWVRAARARGFAAWDGLGLLVHQARRSLALWTGREVPLDPLARAVGWPR